MAYQNVGTPRFYISWGDYWKAQGWDVSRLHTISPYETYSDTIALNDNWESFDHPSETSYLPANGGRGSNFLAVLNHNLSGETWKFFNKRWAAAFEEHDALAEYTSENLDYITPVVNFPPQHTGFSIYTHNPTNYDFSDYPEEQLRAGFRTYSGLYDADEFIGTFGCFVWGKYYDMPHSPDLKLKMSIEMDGVKNIKTKGGASLTGINYTKPADWGSQGAWQLSSTLEDGTQSDVPSNLRSGRRVWDLSFSYLSDSDVMPENAGSSIYAGDGVDNFVTNMMTGTDFFSSVWNKTMGGHLPFIFQPDSSNNNPDQFAICRFDMKSLKITQTMHRKYNVKLKIRESW